MIQATTPTARSLAEVLRDKSFSHVQVRLLAIIEDAPDGRPGTTQELANQIGCAVKTVQRALKELQERAVLYLERDHGGRLIKARATWTFEALDEDIPSPRLGHLDTSTRTFGPIHPDISAAGPGHLDTQADAETINKSIVLHASSTALETKAKASAKDVHLLQTKQVLKEAEPEPEPSVPAPKTGHWRIQEIWPKLTRDPYDLPWCMAMATRYGLAKVVDAFETAYLKDIHQDTLHCPIKAYITKICQNKTAEAAPPPAPKPTPVFTNWKPPPSPESLALSRRIANHRELKEKERIAEEEFNKRAVASIREKERIAAENEAKGIVEEPPSRKRETVKAEGFFEINDPSRKGSSAW